MLEVWPVCRRDLCFLLLSRGSDLQLLQQRRQSLGCNGSGANQGPSSWLPGFQGSDWKGSVRVTGGWPLVRATTIARNVLSPGDGEVIWKGSGGGESTPVWIHAMQNCVSHPPHFRPRRCAATTGLAAQPYGITNLGTPLPPSIASFGGLDENAGTCICRQSSESADCH